MTTAILNPLKVNYQEKYTEKENTNTIYNNDPTRFVFDYVQLMGETYLSDSGYIDTNIESFLISLNDENFDKIEIDLKLLLTTSPGSNTKEGYYCDSTIDADDASRKNMLIKALKNRYKTFTFASIAPCYANNIFKLVDLLYKIGFRKDKEIEEKLRKLLGVKTTEEKETFEKLFNDDIKTQLNELVTSYSEEGKNVEVNMINRNELIDAIEGQKTTGHQSSLDNFSENIYDNTQTLNRENSTPFCSGNTANSFNCINLQISDKTYRLQVIPVDYSINNIIVPILFVFLGVTTQPRQNVETLNNKDYLIMALKEFASTNDKNKHFSLVLTFENKILLNEKFFNENKIDKENVIKKIKSLNPYAFTSLNKHLPSDGDKNVIEIQKRKLLMNVKAIHTNITNSLKRYDSVASNSGGATKVFYKGYYYKIRQTSRKMFITTKDGNITLSAVRSWNKRQEKDKKLSN